MTWNNITIGKYIEILEVSNKDITEEEKIFTMASIAAGKNIKQVNIDEAAILLNQFNELDFTEIPYKIVTKWRNYRVVNNVDRLMAYQGTKILELSDPSNLHIIMALLSFPKRKWLTNNPDPLDEEEIKKRAELFYNEMPITVAYGNWVFFWKVSIALDKGIKPFSKAMQQLKKMNPMDLLSIGDGT